MSNACQQRFIADAMLGRLARWLRMLGIDTLYMRDIKDSELVRLARAEGRCLLTRDRALVNEHHLANYVLLRANDTGSQLRELSRSFAGGLSLTAQGRCTSCNGGLCRVEKTDIVNEVPQYVYYTNDEFTRCYMCGKVFWAGTHRDRFIKMVRGLIV
ncbi:Mut7-C RNAse domain-containing protein [Candidatus Magnetobacterium casense]|uniref:Mut7-C RNAse domain-containing protein n=1 Tax=Candidatus Magnetobacterium casense TaxID=1455061 RepID=UPI00069655DE|nr:Mut7-C RNAse domain-containing protein [Candidatus Magnetobacterium casensis]